jgi:dynein heavy chain 1
LETIDAWLDASSQGRANIPPERIPWDALRSLLKQTIYGGKLDNDFDQLLLNSFVDSLFTAKSYEIGFRLVEKIQLTAPEGTRVSQYLDWAKQLPDRQHPSWLDLEDDAEKLINRSKGMR